MPRAPERCTVLFRGAGMMLTRPGPLLTRVPTKNRLDAMSTSRRRFLGSAAGGALAAARGLGAAPEGPIRIDVGRQLLVDDCLIAQTSLRRSFHKPRIHDAS